MRWVDVKSYVGWDRRGKRGLRLFDRRSESVVSTPPSLATALRQLRMRCFDLKDAEGVCLTFVGERRSVRPTLGVRIRRFVSRDFPAQLPSH